MASCRFGAVVLVAVCALTLHCTSALPAFALGLGDWVQQEAEVPVHNTETSSWVHLSRADSDKLVRLTVALRVDADRRDELERVLLEVSDPDHLRYGKHLSQDQVTELLAVPAARAADTAAYFQAAGARKVETAPNGDMLTVTMPVVSAEAALKTELHEFQHSEHTKVQIVRAGAPYYLPAKIAEHVSMVGELLQFPRLVPKKVISVGSPVKWANSCDARGCTNLVTPSVIAQRYKLPDQTLPEAHQAHTSNSMAVAEFQGQFWKKSDLDGFGTSCHRDVSVAKTIGDEEPHGGIESELDIEYIKAVAPEIPLTVIYNGQFSLLKWANQISSMADPPLVHSVSYGNDEKQQSSARYMYTCNTAFMKAGARGISILFASGDQGVCGREGCGSHFNPDFPAASPYITAVGGTDFEGDDIGPETTWNSGGGGFSDTFAIPSWQADAVAAYKQSPDANLPPQRMWNNTGRGYPDVAALGGLKNPYCVNVGGTFEGVAGTSASCPVVAGIFAKLNGLRLAKGKSPLGFLNPFIYKNPSGFQDVTSGTNSAGGESGFTAVKGWDAATGFGTPDFKALSGLVMGIQALEETTLVV
mmetsp:Transcript_154765/g.494877  ORF Transcript_154765/g.494877 Transcript_154765/m.494877 type:complete len:588 (+) Transcript_154765:69-1832(+)